MNTLLLQDLFYRVMNDLELAEDSYYNDELSKIMKYHCVAKRRKYISEFRKILNEIIIETKAINHSQGKEG